MESAKPINRWLLAFIVLLLVVTVTGTVALWVRYPGSQAIEITLTQPEKFQGEIYIGGAVTSPGVYPLGADETLTSLLQAAGGITKDASLSSLRLDVSSVRNDRQSQKVDLNRAEAWLLKALPDIGDVRAKAIIEYRNRNGGFNNIFELTQVEGMSIATFEKVKNLITVGD